MKELVARGDLQRCLVVCPGSLAEQWQDELYRRFHLPFEILTNDKLEAAKTGNWFLETNLAIARLDKLSRNTDVALRRPRRWLSSRSRIPSLSEVSMAATIMLDQILSLAGNLDDAVGTIDRARASADFVQKSAAAIGTAYAAVAGLTYAASQGTPLPPRGFLPTVFLPLAIFFATAFLAFITRPDTSPPNRTSGNLRENQRLRRDAFINWQLMPRSAARTI
jgi:hypothetical protein